MQPQRTSKNPSKLTCVLLLLCSCLLANTQSLAKSRDDNRQNRNEQAHQEQPRARISASQAAELVKRQYGGKVMNVQTRQSNSGVVYSVKILQTSGHMRTVNVDGQSGAILN
jgi:uncharacterized membrane protein YkoI